MTPLLKSKVYIRNGWVLTSKVRIYIVLEVELIPKSKFSSSWEIH